MAETTETARPRNPTEELQLPFILEPGEMRQLPLGSEDVGGEILAVLSKGLYTNPLDCIREYVQNSVDARAETVTIKLTGNSVTVFDDGEGMGPREVLQARKFGLSPKSVSENVGFRGIGIYSGFDLCRKLQIMSTREGDPGIYTLVFDFAAMREILERERAQGLSSPRTSLTALLSQHTQIGYDENVRMVGRHYTQVELHDVRDVHIKQLSNRAELRRYLLQTLPIDFAPDFPFATEIDSHLRVNVPGYSAIRITLQADGLPDERVEKYSASDFGADGRQPKLQPPTFGVIRTGSGSEVAYYWACLNSDRSRLQPQPRSGKGASIAITPDYEGFVYKIKGFTAGDRRKLGSTFARKPVLYNWYTGEIYVLDPRIIPNAERDDFETSPEKRALELAVRLKLGELESAAENYQAEGVASERIENYQREIAQLGEQVDAKSSANEYDVYARLEAIRTDLRRQKLKAASTDQRAAEDLLKRVERLQRVVRKEVDAAADEAPEIRRSSSRPTRRARPVPAEVRPLPAQPVKSLGAILADAGWDLDDDGLRLTDLLQACIDEALSDSSARALLQAIEARMASQIGED